jgi:hypothetical protein
MKLDAMVSIPQSIVSNEPESIETNKCWSVPEDLEKGPSSIDFPSTSSALTTRSQNNYHDLPDLVKLEIAALVLLPENQTIRIIWNHDARVWIYRGNDIPFVQFVSIRMKPLPLLDSLGNFSQDNVPLLLELSALSNH